MIDFKPASWVTDGYIEWVNDYAKGFENSLDDDEKPYLDDLVGPAIEFFSREDSKYKIQTLISIKKLNKCKEGPVNYAFSGPINSELDILNDLISISQWGGQKYGTVNKKDFHRSIESFRKATDNLFEVIDKINGGHQLSSINLIDDLGKNFFFPPSAPKTEDDRLSHAIQVLNSFFEKSAQQVLIEFINNIESKGNGNPHYLVSNREATETQIKVRKMLYYISSLVGIETTKALKGLGPLITHILDIVLPDQDPLCVRDVNRQIKTAIKLCEVHDKPFIGV